MFRLLVQTTNKILRSHCVLLLIAQDNFSRISYTHLTYTLLQAPNITITLLHLNVKNFLEVPINYKR